jgi:hypothetical protein
MDDQQLIAFRKAIMFSIRVRDRGSTNDNGNR